MQRSALVQVYAAHNEVRNDKTEMTKNCCKGCGTSLNPGVNWTPGLVKKNYLLCKECNVLKSQKYNNTNKETRAKYYEQYWKKRYQCETFKATQADYVRERKYGIQPQEFKILLDQQNNKCACCSDKFTKHNGPKVDHCHKTGSIRGLLCNKCNSGIGFLGDDLDGVQKALKYLELQPPVTLNSAVEEA